MECIRESSGSRRLTNAMTMPTMQKLKKSSKEILIIRDLERNTPLAICTADNHQSSRILALSTEMNAYVVPKVSEKLLLTDLLNAPCDAEELGAFLRQCAGSVYSTNKQPLLLRIKSKAFVWVELTLGKDAELLELLAGTGTLQLTENELVQVVKTLITVDNTDIRVSPRDVQEVSSLEIDAQDELSFDEVFES